MATGIPIKIVVLTIVGMAGLAAMLTIIDNAESVIPKPIHANVESANLIILSTLNDTEDIYIKVKVDGTIESESLKKASVAIYGMGASETNVTNSDGYAVIVLKKADFDMKSGEGYLKLTVKANGFQDYSNEYAVKIVR